jgi:hypothetical protein
MLEGKLGLVFYSVGAVLAIVGAIVKWRDIKSRSRRR